MVLPAFHSPMTLEERAVPSAADGGEIVRVRAAGVCHSDLHIAEGDFGFVKPPVVLGHEIAGDHDRLGAVVVYAPWGCGTCKHCRESFEVMCERTEEAGIVHDGGYADHVRVPSDRFLVPIGDLDPVQAAPLACGGLTPYRAVKHVAPTLRDGSRVLSVGAGGLGQFGIQYLKLTTDAEVTAVDSSEEKRARAIELGADFALPLDEVEGRFDAVIDFVGAQSTLEQAARLVDRRGIVVLAGLFGGEIPFSFRSVPFEARLMTTMWGSIDELREVVAHAQRGDIRQTITTMPLEQANEAHAAVREGRADGRIVLLP